MITYFMLLWINISNYLLRSNDWITRKHPANPMRSYHVFRKISPKTLLEWAKKWRKEYLTILWLNRITKSPKKSFTMIFSCRNSLLIKSIAASWNCLINKHLGEERRSWWWWLTSPFSHKYFSFFVETMVGIACYRYFFCV